MQLKLFLKQSLRDFLNKIILYLTFTIFLVLSISVSLGMISFSYGYVDLYNQVLGHQRVNAFYNNYLSFLPASVAEETENTEWANYTGQEQVNAEGVGYLEQFLKDYLDLTREDKTPITADDEIQRLLLGIGYTNGDTQVNLTQANLLQDRLLNRYFNQGDGPRANLENYNQDLLIVRKELNLKYQTNNLTAAYWIQYFFDHPQDYLLGGFRRWEDTLEIQTADGVEPLWFEHLRVDSSMGKLYDETPQTLRTNATNRQKIYSEVNWDKPKYQKYWDDNYRFVYVTPAFLHYYHLKVGDVVQLHFKNWNNTPNPPPFEEYLIAGEALNSESITTNRYQTVFIPYPHSIAVFDEINAARGQTDFQKIANRPHVFYDILSFNVLSQKSGLAGGQEVASKLYSQVLINWRNPYELFHSDTSWMSALDAYAYNFAQELFLIIAYLIGFLTLILLFMVFYFITQQIVVMQRKTLFFLKAMGIRDSGLSLLTTLAMVPPLLIGLGLGFFGALSIQQMMYGIVHDNQNFYMGYFSFNFVYFVALIGIVGFTFLAFYLINIALIKSKSLTIEGMGAMKTNNLIFEKTKSKMTKVSPQLRIGLSFAFKNVYKNLISYVILSITFGVILFGTQFNKSLDVSAHAYERWNLPYRSVLYADNLKVFAPTREDEDLTQDGYIQGYEPISNLGQLENIDSNDKLLEVAQRYRNSLQQADEFNWKDFSIDKAYTRDKLDLIADNEQEKDDLIEWLIENLELNDDASIISVNNFVNAVVGKYRSVRDEYNYRDGFTILFGRVFTPQNLRSILATEVTNIGWLDSRFPTNLLAYGPGDFDTQEHFGLADFETNEDFVIDGQYQEQDPNTGQMVTKEGKLLKVNVSSFLASLRNIHRGDVLKVGVSGLKSVENADSGDIRVVVNNILNQDSVRPTLYTSQSAMIHYMVEDLQQQIQNFVHVAPFALVNEQIAALNVQLKAYQDLLAKLENSNQPTSLDNTVFDTSTGLPIGVQYITMPVFHHTDTSRDTGARIEDFYDHEALPAYFNQIGRNAMIFSIVTAQALRIAAPFNEMMQKFIIILLVISFVVSSILITLVLLENRAVILLFKAMGYKKSEVNWYLISGYFVAAIFATMTAVALALVTLKATSSVIAQFLFIAVYFVWSWEFIVFAFALAGAFCLAISVAIVIYTNIQKPRDAFVAL